jgi:RecJ-like exonuclease
MFAKKHIQFFYCEEPSLAGSVAGAGIQFYFDQSRPVFGLSAMERVTKISARGTREQIARGIDLATACREAAESVEGDGGGHNIASGATVPKGKEEKFLGLADEIVGRQLRGSATL